MEEKDGPGRPKLSEEIRRDDTLQVRLSEEELQILRNAALSVSKGNVSGFVRTASLDKAERVLQEAMQKVSDEMDSWRGENSEEELEEEE